MATVKNYNFSKYKGPQGEYFTDTHGRLRANLERMKRDKLNGNSGEFLESLGDEYAKDAFAMFKAHITHFKEVMKEISHHPISASTWEPARTNVPCWHDGIEEFMATRIYDIVNIKKRDSFLSTFFSEKMLSNELNTLCYYSGPHCGNNYLYETMLLGGKQGKRIALGMAKNIEKIIFGGENLNCLSHLDSPALDASRFYRLVSVDHYKSFMSKVKKINPALYEKINIEPKDFNLSAMNTTFQEVLDNEKESFMKVLHPKSK